MLFRKNKCIKQTKGIRLSVKSLWNIKNWRVNADSRILYNYISEFDSEIIGQLEKHFEITLVGQTLSDEFGTGDDGTTSSFYPKDIEKGIFGGSSTGAAYAIDKDLCDLSLGSDTGGSIASPAMKYKDQFSIKFTYGAVSRHGLISLSQSLDTPAFISKNIDLLIQITEALSKSEKILDISNPKTTLNRWENILKPYWNGTFYKLSSEERYTYIEKWWRSYLEKQERMNFRGDNKYSFYWCKYLFKYFDYQCNLKFVDKRFEYRYADEWEIIVRNLISQRVLNPARYFACNRIEHPEIVKNLDTKTHYDYIILHKRLHKRYNLMIDLDECFHIYTATEKYLEDIVFQMSKEEINQTYEYVVSGELYSNMVRYDGSIGMKNNHSFILDHWKQFLNPKCLKRILRGRMYILTGKYKKGIQNLQRVRNALNITPGFFVYHWKYKGEEDDWVLKGCNILGFPRVTYDKDIYIGARETDLRLLKIVKDKYILKNIPNDNWHPNNRKNKWDNKIEFCPNFYKPLKDNEKIFYTLSWCRYWMKMYTKILNLELPEVDYINYVSSDILEEFIKDVNGNFKERGKYYKQNEEKLLSASDFHFDLKRFKKHNIPYFFIKKHYDRKYKYKHSDLIRLHVIKNEDIKLINNNKSLFFYKTQHMKNLKIIYKKIENLKRYYFILNVINDKHLKYDAIRYTKKHRLGHALQYLKENA